MEKKTTKNKEDNSFAFVFSRINYILLIAGIVLIALGYILLSGGGSDDPNTFNPAMFDTRRLYVAPILIVIGFLVEIVAIMYNTKKKQSEEE